MPSTSATGGSIGSDIASRSGARRGRNSSVSSPRARAWIRSPSGPNRATTAERGSSATEPIVRSPNRSRRPRTSGERLNNAEASGARNAASSRGSTRSRGRPAGAAPLRPAAAPLPPLPPLPLRPAIPAATAAENRVPPIPASGAPGSTSRSKPHARSAIRVSEPQSRSRPSSWISIRPNPAESASISATRPGLSPPRISRAPARAASSVSRSGSRKTASGASRWAAPSGIPIRTPSSSADRLASMTKPCIHGLPPRTIGSRSPAIGSDGNGSEDRSRARRSRRWGQ